MSKKNLEGFALQKTPLNLYTPQEVSGVNGRFIRLLPSLTNGDGFLTISQLQVLDMYGNNMAVNGTASASSSGGSPLDKKYGSFVMNGSAKIASPGISAGPNAAIDGTKAPRDDLISIFSTSIQNACSGCNSCRPCPNTGPACSQYGASMFNYNPKTMMGCDKKALDNQYWELDLGSEHLISSIIYMGRSNPQNDLNPWQGCRIKGMRLIILNAARHEVYNSTTATTPVFTTNDLVQTIKFPNPVFSNVQVQQTTATDIYIPNIAGYRTWMNTFVQTNGATVGNSGKLFDIANYLALINTVKPKKDSNLLAIDISYNVIPSLLSSSDYNYANNQPMSALNVYYDIYGQVANTPVPQGGTKPALPADMTGPKTIPVQVLGTVTAEAAQEMVNSINLSQKLNLSVPSLIDYYLRVAYPTSSSAVPYQPFIRNAYLFCQPEVMQIFRASDGSFQNVFSFSNQAWNETNCTGLLDDVALSLLPFGARNFIIQWIYERATRYNNFCKAEAKILYPTFSALQDASIYCADSVQLLSYKKPQINVTSATLLNGIARQFYEMLNGDFNMSYIYDVQTIGQTILDVRFDLVVHTNFAAGVEGPIADLKAQYQKIKDNKTLSQDMINTIDYDYATKLNGLINNEMADISQPIYGVVVRLFYTTLTTTGSTIDPANIKITGMIFDEKAVTSFNQELNCAIPVPSGTNPGNVNFVPKITYTLNKNIAEKLDCTNEQTLKRIMNDYYTAVINDPKILNGSKSMEPKVNTSKVGIFINSILGAKQISPNQCAVAWTEQLYDPMTNMAVYSSGSSSGSSSTIQRQAVFNYTIDTKNWYVSEMTFDPGVHGSRIKFYPTTEIPDCVFNPTSYQKATIATANMATNDIYKYFSLNTLKGGEGTICPDVLPGYTFDASGYIHTNKATNATLAALITTDPLLTTDATYKAAIGIYKTRLAAGTNDSVKGTNSITIFPTPYTYTKPLPFRSNLETQNNKCPVTNCEDLDVLYSLAQQYNSDITSPGTIVRITRAFTPSPYQCDIEADMTYSGTDLDVLSGSMISKGGIKYSVGSNGLQSTATSTAGSGVQAAQTFSMSVQLDALNCEYLLAKTGAPGSGTSIQPNTPYLYKPMEYATEFAARTMSNTGSVAASIIKPTTSVGSSARALLTNYRVNTTTAAANIKAPAQTHRVTPSPPTWSAISAGSVPLTVTPPVLSGFTDYSPLSHRAFGLDRARNGDDSYKDIQYQTPTEQVFPKAEAGKPYPAYKYIRFNPLRARVQGAGISVGKFSFFFGGQEVSLPTTSVRNRMGTWIGVIGDVVGGGGRSGFYDSHGKPLVFAFSKPVVIDSYSLTTATGNTDADPISWKMEGSSTGTYWEALDIQDRYPMPMERSKTLPVFLM